MAAQAHGDLPRWRAALQSLPHTDCSMQLDQAAPSFGGRVRDSEALRATLMALHPWRKGPLQLGGVEIDTEWRSDWKWNRLRTHVDLSGQRILDIGCGNGYFGWRMLGAGAQLVIGIDPTLVYLMQFLACRHFAGPAAHFVLPLGVEQLPAGSPGFDTVFSMGVIYHRRDPLAHLQQIHTLLDDGGALVLESLVLPGDEPGPLLVPRSRYARMRNVWAIPSCRELQRWVLQAGFASAVLLDVSVTTVDEQRRTDWMKFESLAQALDPNSPGRTLEGYPAPVRALLLARR
jgi:tRNA (mo5U34)-methyltransferase